jgi:CBS domain-containing protein
MEIQDIMTTSPETCGRTTNLAVAVERLWKADCGVLPVVDYDGSLVGIITDRDICIALGTRNRPASTILVENVMTTAVETCREDEDVVDALARMKERRVRRLPVVDDRGKLVGILSLNDIILATGSGAKAIKPAAVLQTFKAICAQNLPVPVSDRLSAPLRLASGV